MKVKVGDQVFDGQNQPVMVILSERDRENIRNMHPDSNAYASAPEDYGEEKLREWMATH